jgi:hypothetical protein
MRRVWWRVALLTAACAVAPGCGDGDSGIPPACRNGGCRSQRDETALWQWTITRDVDVLFVLDDTPDIASRADAVTAGLGNAAVLLGPEAPVAGGAPSVHVAFVSASNAAGASPSARATNCGVMGPEAFLTTGKCGRTPNTTGSFGDAFACLANLGDASTGSLEPIAALRRALDPGGGQALADFLRPRAFLQIVIVSAQDDAGTTPVDDVVQFLKSLKEDPSYVLVSVVGPPLDCGDAAPERLPPRLGELMTAFDPNGLYAALCWDSAVSAALQRLFLRNGTFSGVACFPAIRDTDPTTPGLQPDCVFVDHAYPEVDGGFSSTSVDRVLPDCDHGPPPCWRLMPATAACGAGGAAVLFDHGPDWCAQEDMYTSITCLTCLHADDPACQY